MTVHKQRLTTHRTNHTNKTQPPPTTTHYCHPRAEDLEESLSGMYFSDDRYPPQSHLPQRHSLPTSPTSPAVSRSQISGRPVVYEGLLLSPACFRLLRQIRSRSLLRKNRQQGVVERTQGRLKPARTGRGLYQMITTGNKEHFLF